MVIKENLCNCYIKFRIEGVKCEPNQHVYLYIICILVDIGFYVNFNRF